MEGIHAVLGATAPLVADDSERLWMRQLLGLPTSGLRFSLY